jgi:hypothetical protein
LVDAVLTLSHGAISSKAKLDDLYAASAVSF